MSWMLFDYLFQIDGYALISVWPENMFISCVYILFCCLLSEPTKLSQISLSFSLSPSSFSLYPLIRFLLLLSLLLKPSFCHAWFVNMPPFLGSLPPGGADDFISILISAYYKQTVRGVWGDSALQVQW